VLLNGERLASDGRLVDLQEGVLGNNAAVGGDDGALLNLEDVTGNDVLSSNLYNGAIAQDNSLEGERLLELLHDRAGLELLHETDNGVEQQETANDAKVDPVLETGGKDGGSLHDELDGADKVAEELENEVLLLLLCAAVSSSAIIGNARDGTH
jgi:hypothetical protein